MNAPGFWEWIFLGAIALLIFGPERLPKMAYTAGQMIARFKREAAGTLDELKAAAELEEFSDVARDLRATGRDLRAAGQDLVRSADLSDTIAGAGAVKAHSAVMPSGEPGGPPPFDPDTP